MTDIATIYENAEASLLGGLIESSYAIYEYAPKVSQVFFSSKIHKNIYKAIKHLYEQGVEPTQILVKTELISMGLYDESGGDEYIDYLSKIACPYRNIYALIDQVIKTYKVRKLLEINSRIPLALDVSTVDEVISSLSLKLDQLSSEAGKEDVSLLSDILKPTIDRIVDRTTSPGIRGVSTGFKDIDRFTGGFNASDIWFLGARPSMGKSSLALKMAANVAKQGVPVALFNKEMGSDSLVERLLSMLAGIPLQDIRLGLLNKEQIISLIEYGDSIQNLPIYIDNNFSGNVDYVVSAIRKLVQLYDIKVVFIDYIQLLVDRTADSTNELGRASRALKLLANQLKITIVILSQVNRDCEKREDKRPLMADLRQSGNLEEDADIMIALYREAVYLLNSPAEDEMEAIFRKQRNGPLGTIVLEFDSETTNITNGRDTLWSADNG